MLLSKHLGSTRSTKSKKYFNNQIKTFPTLELHCGGRKGDGDIPENGNKRINISSLWFRGIFITTENCCIGISGNTLDL